MRDLFTVQSGAGTCGLAQHSRARLSSAAEVRLAAREGEAGAPDART